MVWYPRCMKMVIFDSPLSSPLLESGMHKVCRRENGQAQCNVLKLTEKVFTTQQGRSSTENKINRIFHSRYIQVLRSNDLIVVTSSLLECYVSVEYGQALVLSIAVDMMTE